MMTELDHFLFRPAPPRRMPTLRRLMVFVDVVSRQAYRARWGTWPAKHLTVRLSGRRRAVTCTRMMEGPA